MKKGAKKDDTTPSKPAEDKPAEETPQSAVLPYKQLGDDLLLIEMQIGIACRRLSLAYMCSKASLKDLAEYSLKAKHAYEGSLQEVEWREKLQKKIKPKNLEELKARKAALQKELMQVMTRKKEVQLVQAEKALEEMGEEDGGGSKVN